MEDPIPANFKPSRLAEVAPLTDVLAASSKHDLRALHGPSAGAYLSYLTTLPLTDLVGEPTSLQTQSHHLTSSLTSLTHTSYPTFLSLHRTTTSLINSLSSLSTSLDALLTTSLPALEECAAGWKERTDPVLRERSKARVVLEQHEKLRDLLDIPLLIDTCVRNGYFSEALSLASHATTLASNASAEKPPLILSAVMSEVHNSVAQMLFSLLATLYEPNRKLPALWKAVNFLRKMDAFGTSSAFVSQPATTSPDDQYVVSSEQQLALAFLVGRESCLKGALEPHSRDIMRLVNDGELEDREKEDLARFLKKYIDTWREGVYDIITQYSTIFLERHSSTSTPAPQSSAKPNGNSATHLLNGNSTQSDEDQHLHVLLTTYASRTLSTYLIPVLSSSLPFLSLSLLPSLLTQFTYCSNAFARVGLDFSGVIGVLFTHSVTQVVSRDFKTAAEKWQGRLQKAISATANTTKRERDRDRSNANEIPSNWLIIPSLAASPPLPDSPSLASQSPAHIPPQILASYPPLAEYTNSLLGVLNGLRLLAPPSVLPDLMQVLETEVLAQSGEALVRYIKTVEQSHTEAAEREKKVAHAAGKVYFDAFVPFLRRALVEGVFGLMDGIREVAGEELRRVIREWEAWIKSVNEEDE